MLQPADAKGDILDSNSRAMHLCQHGSFTEAYEVLEQVYLRLQDESAFADVTVLDQLKATTFTNLGVVQSHLGDHDKAIDHLEAAHATEIKIGKPSPCTLLNLCAACNAIGDFDRASECARLAVSLLHQGGTVNEDNKMLWGAAWHNLGIAELNRHQGKDQNGSALSHFRNAMRASVDLLGPQHPMTLAVHDTYRSLRAQFKAGGSFLAHHSAAHREDTPRDGPRPVTAVPTLPYIAASHCASGTPRTPRDAAKNSRPPTRPSAVFHPTKMTTKASRIYSAQHPLFQQQNRNEKLASIIPHPPTVRAHSKPQRAASPPQWGSSHQPLPGRHLEDRFVGDTMWVEVDFAGRPLSGEKPSSPIRPSYGQAEHVIDPSDAVADEVASPASNPTAVLESTVRSGTAASALADALGDEAGRFRGISALLATY